MSTGKLRLQILAFCVIAACGVTYVAARYVGLGRMAGVEGYAVTAELPRTGGLFVNGEVTYRGVPVGRITELTASPDGVRADLLITDEDVDIPRDLEALVRNRSAIGEQYLDLRPNASDPPYLAEGDTIEVAEADLPVPLDSFMEDVVAFNRSVPTKALGRLVDELYLASEGTGDDLAILLSSSNELADLASANIDVTTSLIDNSESVLQTQADSSAAIRSFSSDLRLLADEIATHDADLRALIRSTPGVARELTELIDSSGRPLSVLLGDFLTINGVLADHDSDLQSLLGDLPSAVSAVDAAVTPTGLRVGLTTNFGEPYPCTTGYRQRMRPGTATSDVPLMLGTGCSGGLPRGARSAPRY